MEKYLMADGTEYNIIKKERHIRAVFRTLQDGRGWELVCEGTYRECRRYIEAIRKGARA